MEQMVNFCMYFGIALSLAMGNFLYQFLKSQNWSQALERTFFQVIAIILCAIVSYFNKT